MLALIFWCHLLRAFAEQHLDEGQGCWVQLLQLLLLVAHLELRNVEERFLFVLPQEWRQSCQHHVRQHTNAPKDRKSEMHSKQTEVQRTKGRKENKERKLVQAANNSYLQHIGHCRIWRRV